MSDPDSPLTASDVIRLYGDFNRQLTRIVRATTAGSRPLIEDACQIAWTALICPGQSVERRNARAWLIRTAIRAATRLMQLEAREPSLERLLQEQPHHLRSESALELVRRREQMESVRLLSARQQRLVWLRALGFSHGEMAGYEGTTVRTIRRQLERAQRQLRDLDDVGQVNHAAAA